MKFIFLAGRSVGGNHGTRSLQNCFFASSVETQTGKPKINKSRKSRALPSTNPGNTRNKERTGQTTSVPGNRQQNEAFKRKKQRNWNCFSSFPKLRPAPSKNACSRRKKRILAPYSHRYNRHQSENKIIMNHLRLIEVDDVEPCAEVLLCAVLSEFCSTVLLGHVLNLELESVAGKTWPSQD